jgi:hypothetical protein
MSFIPLAITDYIAFLLSVSKSLNLLGAFNLSLGLALVFDLVTFFLFFLMGFGLLSSYYVVSCLS